MTAVVGPHPWAVAALREECERLAAVAAGDRANRAYRAAYAVGGLVETGGLGVEDVEESLAAAAVASGLPEREARSHVRRGLRDGAKRPREIPEGLRGSSRVRLVFRAPSPPAPPRYPPTDEVAALWAACVPVYRDDEVADYLEGRELDPVAVAVEDILRALPRGAVLPAWARCGSRAWTDSAHRLVGAWFGADGRLVTLRARAIVADPRPAKALAAEGFEFRGAVLADFAGRALLRGERVARWDGRTVLVVEGEPDAAAWVSSRDMAAAPWPALLAVDSGSWTADLAARIPDGCRVLVRTHLDAAGERYARGIVATLAGRDVEVLRLREGPAS